MSAQTLLGVRLATFAAVAEIGIHLYLLPDHLAEQPYIGWLFIASAVVLTAVVVGLAAPGALRSAGYLVGAVVCVGMFGGFVASRTVGLPLGYHEGWFMDDSLGIVSLAFEVVFVACAARALRPTALQIRGRALLLVSAAGIPARAPLPGADRRSAVRPPRSARR